MGTCNFLNVNASKVFAVLTSYERPIMDDEGNYSEETELYTPDEFDVAELINELKAELTTDDSLFWDRTVKSVNENRNFPSRYIATVFIRRNFADIDCVLYIHCFLRAGYYDGANLDWECELTFNSYPCEDVKDITDDFQSVYTDMNVGMQKIQTKNCQRWVDRSYDKLVKYVESAYEKCSTPYVHVGTFSNGEGIYEKA